MFLNKKYIGLFSKSIPSADDNRWKHTLCIKIYIAYINDIGSDGRIIEQILRTYYKMNNT